MRKWLCCVLPLWAVAACESSGGDATTGGKGDLNVTVVRGYVFNQDDAPLSGVAVSGGGATTTSDAAGFFELSAASADHTVVRLIKAGFIPGSAVVDVQNGKATGVEVHLRTEAPAVQIDAEQSAQADGQRGAAMATEGGAFVDAAGAAVAGMVDVHLTPIDPSNDKERATYPGDWTAKNDTDNVVMLESFGVLDVTVRQNGEKLQVKDGEQLTITVPPPALQDQQTLPPTMPLWSYDETVGQWKQEGIATLTDVGGQKYYVGSIGHMSAWNCDKPLLATCLKGVVKDVDTGAPVAGAYVVANGVDYFGSSSATANADGEFCVAVRKGSKVSVDAIHPNGGGTVREVNSLSGDTTVPPDCDDPRCQDGGLWEIKNKYFTDASGNAVACETAVNPFASSCFSSAWSGFECFQPEGTCESNYTAGGASIEYSNGSKMISSGAGVGGGTNSFYGPTGELCFTTEFGAFVPDQTEFTYTINVDGQSWEMTFDQESHTQTVKCPGGQEIVITEANMQKLEACSGPGEGTSDQRCTVNREGYIYGDVSYDDDTSTNDSVSFDYEGTCNSNSQCGNGQRCCKHAGVGVCTALAECGACDTSADCAGYSGGSNCCSSGSYKFCATTCP